MVPSGILSVLTLAPHTLLYSVSGIPKKKKHSDMTMLRLGYGVSELLVDGRVARVGNTGGLVGRGRSCTEKIWGGRGGVGGCSGCWEGRKAAVVAC